MSSPDINKAQCDAEAGVVLEVNMSLRLFLRDDVDANKIVSLINEHFGKGDAIVGSGYEGALASELKRAVIADIKSSDADAAHQIQTALIEVDVWRDERCRDGQKQPYEIVAIT